MRITSARVVLEDNYHHLLVDFADIKGTARIDLGANLHLVTRGWEAVNARLGDEVPELTLPMADGPTSVRGFTDDPEVVKLAWAFIAEPGLPVGPVDLDALGVAHT